MATKTKQAPLGNRGGLQQRLSRQASAQGKSPKITKVVPAKKK